MGLFKDFKEDFSQAVNELGPDGTPETNATDNLVVDTIGENVVYDQGVGKFEKNLSIIDVMMFNEISIIRHFLQEYELNR